MDAAAGPGPTASRGPCAGIPEQMDFIRQVLDRVGDKWSLLVIAVLEGGPLRYNDLLRQVPGISQRMLTLTVRQLQQDGLVTRTAYAEVSPRVEYALAPLGRGLLEIVTSLVRWASDHHEEIRELNRPGFDRDSSVVSGDQTGQVAQLPQSLELGRWPAPAGSVKSPIVVPVHPCCGGDVDFFDIVPRPAGLYQLGLVQADR
jgi:DNA-binding HxlR family transcriptional regulator